MGRSNSQMAVKNTLQPFKSNLNPYQTRMGPISMTFAIQEPSNASKNDIDVKYMEKFGDYISKMLETEDPVKVIRAVNLKYMTPEQVALVCNKSFTQSTLFDPEKKFFN